MENPNLTMMEAERRGAAAAFWAAPVAASDGRWCAAVLSAAMYSFAADLDSCISELACMPAGSHIGELGSIGANNRVASALPACHLTRYDHPFCVQLKHALRGWSRDLSDGILHVDTAARRVCAWAAHAYAEGVFAQNAGFLSESGELDAVACFLDPTSWCDRFVGEPFARWVDVYEIGTAHSLESWFDLLL